MWGYDGLASAVSSTHARLALRFCRSFGQVYHPVQAT